MGLVTITYSPDIFLSKIVDTICFAFIRPVKDLG